jgi:hypothetical protein
VSHGSQITSAPKYGLLLKTEWLIQPREGVYGTIGITNHLKLLFSGCEVQSFKQIFESYPFPATSKKAIFPNEDLFCFKKK